MTEDLPRRFLIETAADHWRAVDLMDIYVIEAEGHDCLVRLRSKDELVDRRRMAELEAVLSPRGFVRVHRSYLVNPARVFELRRRDEGRGWEMVMEPPVNRVLPVAEPQVAALRAAIEGGAG